MSVKKALNCQLSGAAGCAEMNGSISQQRSVLGSTDPVCVDVTGEKSWLFQEFV